MSLPSNVVRGNDKTRIPHANARIPGPDAKPPNPVWHGPRCATCGLVLRPQWGQKRCKCLGPDIHVHIDKSE